MSLWNPYGFTITGTPILSRAPAALRVVGGPASATQLASAQSVFSSFCARARTSAAPNQSESGSLPDGSRYQIAVVGITETMHLWPVPAKQDDAVSGIGIPVLTPSGDSTKRYLFVLSYRNSQWMVRTPKYFYGGNRAWVSSADSSYYLSYQRPDDKRRLYWPAHDAAIQITEEAPPPSVTAGAGGLAYAIGDYPHEIDPTQGGMVSSGIYVQTVPASMSATALGIHSGQMATLAQIKETPEEPAKFTSGYKALALEMPPDLRAHGHHRVEYSLLRDGRRMALPLTNLKFDVRELLFIWQGRFITSVTTDCGISHELNIKFKNGIPSASILKIHDPEVSSVPEDITVHNWKARSLVIHGSPVKINDRYIVADDGSRGFGAVNFFLPLREQTELMKSRRVSAVVFSEYDWNGKRIQFELALKEHSNIKIENNLHTGFDLIVNWARVELWGSPGARFDGDFRASTDLTSEPLGDGLVYQTQPWYAYSTDVNRLTPRLPAGLPVPTRVAELNHDFRSTLSTPWGELVVADVKYQMTMDGVPVGAHDFDPFGPAVPIDFKIRSAGGSAIRIDIVFVDVNIGVVIFNETVIDAGKVRDEGSSAILHHRSVESFVVWHKGEEIYRGQVGEPLEGEASVVNFLASGLNGMPGPSETQKEYTTINGQFTWDVDVYSIANQGIPSAYQYTKTVPNDWEIKYQTREEQEYSFEARDEDLYPWFLFGAPNPSGGLTMKTAVDPGSGASVLIVQEKDVLLGAWAFAPGGKDRVELSRLLSSRVGAPHTLGAIVEDVVTV